MVDYDIDKICRVCLKSDLDLFLLFDEQNAVGGVCLSEMISECTMYTVRRHDDFPHLICNDCKDRVQSAYRFKKQFEASHRMLLTFLESMNKVVLDIAPNVANDKCIQTEECTMYPCEKCDQKFLNYEKLREHRLVSHRGTANLCRLCLKTFNRLADLKNHIAICHPEIGHITRNECPLCNKKFTRKNHVIRHIRNIHKQNPDAAGEGTSPLKTKASENETLAETEIEYGNLTNHEVEAELILKLSPIDCEDNASSSAEFGETNPFSSDEDEKPLSELRATRKASHEDSDEIVVKVEETDNSNVNLPIALPSDERNYVNEENITTDHFQKPKNRRYKCKECDKTFTRNNHAKRHLMSHSQEKPFACTVCEKRFTRADHLKLHLTKHDVEKPYQCDICNKSYSRSHLLKSHQKQKHSDSAKEVCERCNKSFSSKNYLRKHMLLHTERNWKCKWCSLDFESKESLKEHAKSHNKDKPFLCSQCGQRFLRNDYLLIHMRRHNGEKPYKCKYCNKGFPRSTDLNIHEKYHTGEKAHLCTICGKGFQRAYNLIVHMRVHTGERPYQCPHCPKNFAQGNDLKAHVRRHTGERFKCGICGAGFIQGYNLTQHKLAVHGIEVESRISRLVKVSSKDLKEKVLSDVLNEPDAEIKLEQPPLDL